MPLRLRFASALKPISYSKLTSLLIQGLRGPTGVLAMTSVVGILIRVVSSLVLTRVLAPSVFGLAGIIGSLFFTISMLTDLGFEPYVVRHRDSEIQLFRDTLWTVHASRGALLAVLGIVSSPLIAIVLRKPELAMPLAAASLTLAINGFMSFSLFVALRRGGATKLSLLDLALTIFQTAAGIGLALWLRNIWAIVVALIAQSLLKTLLSYVIFPDSVHRIARDRDVQKEFFAFSRIVLASSSIALLISQSDKLFLARFLTLQQYGYYAIALNLVSVPVGFIGTYMGRIIYPKYAHTWNTNASTIGRVYYTARQRVSLLFALASGALVGSAPLLVAILYDARYRTAGVYASLLAVSAAFRLPTFAATEVMTAMGRVHISLHINIVRIVWLAVAGPIGFYMGGSTGVICAVGLLEVPALLYSWVVLRSAGILDMRYEMCHLAMFLGGGTAGYAACKLGLQLLAH